MSKSADAFRTISEVAADLAVPKHVLRFWEGKFAQIRPMKRGGGRRYYRPGDLELLRGIRHLLHAEGYTIKGVQRILREQGVDAVKRFGRDDAPVAPPQMAGRAAATPREPAPAPAPAQQPPAAAPTRATAAERPLSGRELMARMVTELEACRSLLAEGAAPREAARPARRPRAARG
jgi:DNA-binding transcriptional MerR regulator